MATVLTPHPMLGDFGSNVEESEATPSAPAKILPTLKPARTIGSGAALLERMGFIVRRMQREPWLPIAIRSLIAEEYVAMRRLHDHSKLSMDNARDRVRRLALACFKYDDLTLRSATLCQIRALDLEFTGRLP